MDRIGQIVALVDETGTVAHSTTDGRAWLTARRWRLLASALQANGEAAAILTIDGAVVTCTRLYGAAPTQFAVTVLDKASEAPVLHELTARQRQVAEALIVGATIPEIARSLEVSNNTIKTHVRAVYRRIGVHNRVDLVRQLSSTPVPNTPW